MKKGKKFLLLSAVIALLMMCTVFGVSAGTDDMPMGPDAPQYSDNDFYYDIIDGEAVIAGYYGESEEINFPESLNGYPVTKVNFRGSSYCPNFENVTSVYIGAHIEFVDFDTYDFDDFNDFRNLEKITVAEDNMFYTSCEGALYDKELTELIVYPFGCKNTEYFMPDTVESVACEFDCPYLVSVSLSDNLVAVDGFIFSGCDSLQKISVGKNTRELEKFSNCGNIKEISVDSENKYFCTDENGVLFNIDKTILIQYPSAGAKTAYSIPDSVKEIGDGAFENCENLLRVLIPEGVELIGNGSFSHCTYLTEIVIPDSVTKIDERAFEYCRDLRTVSLGKNIELIDRYAFYRCWVEEIIIPDSVKELGDNAFYGCDYLEKIYLPESIELIGRYVFENTAYYEESSNWENGNLYIGKHLIKANTAINILAGTKTIAGGAFSYRKDIIDMVIPNGVVSVGQEAFSGCTNLKNIKIPKSVKILDDGVFSGCTSLVKVELPDGITKISQSLFDYCRALECINIPKSVKEIDAFAFADCEKLKNLYLTEGVEVIGFDSFYGCDSLKNVILPKTLKALEIYAFEDCTNLNEIIFYSSDCEISDDEYTISECATIIGFAGSTAEDYAKKYNRAFIKLIAVTDVHTGIKADYIDETFGNAVPELIVVEGGKNADFVFGDTFNKYSSYDISFEINGEKAQPNGRVTVKIPVPVGYDFETVSVYYVDTNGAETKIDSHYESGYIIFETDHFSEYVLVDESSETTDEPSTEPDEPIIEPDEPDVPEEPSDDCSCNCHKSGFMGFIWKILRIFYKLFKTNVVCACGVTHY